MSGQVNFVERDAAEIQNPPTGYRGFWVDAAGIGYFRDSLGVDTPVASTPAGSVTNANLANVPTDTFKGRDTAGTGSPEDLSIATVKTMLAISNVDNTSDANKPVSTAQQTALNLKSDTASLGGAAILNVGTTAGTVAAGDDSRFTDARHRKMIAYQNTDSTHTGSTAETILCNLSVPAGTLGANAALWMDAFLVKIGTAGTATFKDYIGPNTGSLSGATQIGQLQLTAPQLSGGHQRRLVNKNSASTNNVYPPTTSASYEQVAQAVARVATNIDFSVQQYYMITVTLANSGDTSGIDSVQIYANMA